MEEFLNGNFRVSFVLWVFIKLYFLKVEACVY